MTKPKVCPVDGKPIPPPSFGRPRVYCSVACRQTVERYPAEIESQRGAYEAAQARYETERRRRNTGWLAMYKSRRDRARAKLKEMERVVGIADELTRKHITA